MNLSFSSLSSDCHHIMLTAIALFITTIIFFFTKIMSKRPNLPPGPPGWPIVGNLFQFTTSGKPFFKYLRDDMIPKYGPILTLKMGNRTRIVISNADLVREALIEKGQVFSSRPRDSPTKTVFSCNKFTITDGLYGPLWQALRRNLVQNILKPSKLKLFGDIRNNALDKLIDRLKLEAHMNGAVRVLKNGRFAFSRILITMCFGFELEEEMIQKIDETMKIIVITLIPRIDDYLPFLGPFFYKERKRAAEVRKLQMDVILPLIKRRKLVLENPSTDKTAVSFSYLDTLYELEIDGQKVTPSDAEIVTLCSEFLIAGTDTTGTTTEWAIGQLIDNPKIQSKLYDEIKSVAGDRKLNENDLQKMPYMNAFSKELLRRTPPAYFTLTHGVIEPSTLGGYDIPADSNVEIFLPTISNDPELWSDPDKFEPERFLSGKEDADITGVKEVRMMPFGVGRRICPGLAMATTHVNLMIGRMVQEFEWRPWPENSKVDFSETYEFTVVMKNPLMAAIKPRKPGTVARNSNGEILAWWHHKILHLLDPDVAEAMAALGAIKLAGRAGWTTIILEDDCVNVVKQLRQTSKCLTASGIAIEQGRRL